MNKNDPLTIGTYLIDEYILIQGTVEVAGPFRKRVPQKLPLFKMIQVLLSKLNGAVCEKTRRDFLREILFEAQVIQEDECIKREAEAALADLKETTWTEYNRTNAAVILERVAAFQPAGADGAGTV